MRLANLLDEQLVLHNLTATTKQEAINELLAKIKNKYPEYDYDAILASILDREEIENTSYGRNIAFPHARTDEVDEMHTFTKQASTSFSRVVEPVGGGYHTGINAKYDRLWAGDIFQRSF